MEFIRINKVCFSKSTSRVWWLPPQSWVWPSQVTIIKLNCALNEYGSSNQTNFFNLQYKLSLVLTAILITAKPHNMQEKKNILWYEAMPVYEMFKVEKDSALGQSNLLNKTSMYPKRNTWYNWMLSSRRCYISFPSPSWILEG